MDTPDKSKVDFAAELLKVLVAPALMLTTGLGVFIYEVGWGHDQAFATMGLALAATGAGFGADRLGKFVGK